MSEQVISAISTPPGTGGVAIIRLSGDGALSVAERVFSPVGKVNVKDFTPRMMYAGKILCEGFSDFGYAVYFRAPHSFTGEDVVELHCHGGAEIARAVLKSTIAAGARLAQRGEYTKRAFVNGKLSLSSAEGMIDMINAESLAEVRAGSLLYGERLTCDITGVQEELKNILAGIAADIDYPEEDVAATDLSDVSQRLDGIYLKLKQLADSYSAGKLIKSGVTVAICGAPNVGKSSLLNTLLGCEKAIVSPIAGTTRDVVEGSISIDGVKYNLFDTAGIREQAEEIEAIGIDRAKKILASSDVVVCVSETGDYSAAEGVEEGRLIRVFGKSDGTTPFGKYDVAISSVTGEGIEALKALLSEKSLGGKSLDSAYVIEERHYDALVRAKDKLKEAISGLGNFPLDLISLDLREAWRILGEITGETADEEIISTVFEKFCVGK